MSGSLSCSLVYAIPWRFLHFRLRLITICVAIQCVEASFRRRHSKRRKENQRDNRERDISVGFGRQDLLAYSRASISNTIEY